jgi:hypothetical protein
MPTPNHDDTKHCAICNNEFARIDFPQCFDRMVTCGNPECEGKRRKEKWKSRYENYKNGK